MLYGIHATVKHLQNEINGCSAQIQELSAKLSEREDEISRMKNEVELAREELTHTKNALKDVLTSNVIVHVSKHHRYVKSLKLLLLIMCTLKMNN